jgi:hypothetical protein
MTGERPVPFVTMLRQTRAKVTNRQVDPWRLRLERVRGKIGDDLVERVSSQDLLDMLEAPTQSNGGCLPPPGDPDARARLEPDQGEGTNADRAKGSGKRLGQGSQWAELILVKLCRLPLAGPYLTISALQISPGAPPTSYDLMGMIPYADGDLRLPAQWTRRSFDFSISVLRRRRLDRHWRTRGFAVGRRWVGAQQSGDPQEGGEHVLVPVSRRLQWRAGSRRHGPDVGGR